MIKPKWEKNNHTCLLPLPISIKLQKIEGRGKVWKKQRKGKITSFMYGMYIIILKSEQFW